MSAQPYSQATFEAAARANPTLHPVQAAMRALAGPKAPVLSSAELISRRSDEEETRQGIADWQAQIVATEQRQAAHESWLTSVSVTNPGISAFYGDRRDETAARIKRLRGYIADAEQSLAAKAKWEAA
jgi:hypothetical protein